MVGSENLLMVDIYLGRYTLVFYNTCELNSDCFCCISISTLQHIEFARRLSLCCLNLQVGCYSVDLLSVKWRFRWQGSYGSGRAMEFDWLIREFLARFTSCSVMEYLKYVSEAVLLPAIVSPWLLSTRRDIVAPSLIVSPVFIATNKNQAQFLQNLALDLAIFQLLFA